MSGCTGVLFPRCSHWGFGVRRGGPLKRSPLRRGKGFVGRRPQDSGYNLHESLYDCACWFKSELGFEGPCEFWGGRPDRAHLIRKELLRKFRPDLDRDDPRLWVPACRRHHRLADSWLLGVQPAEVFPAPFLELAEREGFFQVPGRGWRCGFRGDVAA